MAAEMAGHTHILVPGLLGYAQAEIGCASAGYC